MLQMVSRLLPELPLFLVMAVGTHLVMSFAQTLMHFKLGHNPMGGKFFRNHINFHHTYYSKDHLVSRTYLGDEGNNTPFFHSCVFGGSVYLPRIASGTLRGSGSGMCGVVLRARLFRQGIPCRGIMASAVCVVQTEAGVALRSSPAREQQFRGDPFLLG
jgi:hypothetical protein